MTRHGSPSLSPTIVGRLNSLEDDESVGSFVEALPEDVSHKESASYCSSLRAPHSKSKMDRAIERRSLTHLSALLSVARRSPARARRRMTGRALGRTVLFCWLAKKGSGPW